MGLSVMRFDYLQRFRDTVWTQRECGCVCASTGHVKPCEQHDDTEGV